MALVLWVDGMNSRLVSFKESNGAMAVKWLFELTANSSSNAEADDVY